jgi:16S rRNA processing protein RimM
VPSDAIDRLTLARLLRPRGIHGEIAAEILTDFPDRLTKLREVWLWDGNSPEPRTAEVAKCWLSTSRGGQAIFQFAGVDSIEDAEKLRGLEVQVPLSERTKLAAGTYYISELTGCEVWEVGSAVAPKKLGKKSDEEIGEKIGVVRGVLETGTPVLEVDTPEGELLIPLAVEICTKIDVAARRIEVNLPEGLRELNRK